MDCFETTYRNFAGRPKPPEKKSKKATKKEAKGEKRIAVATKDIPEDEESNTKAENENKVDVGDDSMMKLVDGLFSKVSLVNGEFSSPVSVSDEKEYKANKSNNDNGDDDEEKDHDADDSDSASDSDDIDSDDDVESDEDDGDDNEDQMIFELESKEHSKIDMQVINDKDVSSNNANEASIDEDKVNEDINQKLSKCNDKEKNGETGGIGKRDYRISINDSTLGLVNDILEEVDSNIKKDSDPQEVFQYKFSRNFLAPSGSPPVACVECQKLGHSSKFCPTFNIKLNFKPLEPLLKDSRKVLDKLCTEIMKRCQITKGEIQLRHKALDYIARVIKVYFPNCELELFGSSINQFGFHNSDIDICMHFKDQEPPKAQAQMVDTLARILRKSNDIFNVQPIRSAKVPIVKFVIFQANLEADISLGNMLALHNSKLLRCYAEADERVRVLGYVAKYFAKICEIGDASRGSLSSYAHLLMVLHYLQQCKPPVIPVLQELYEGGKKPINMHSNWNCWFYDNVNLLPNAWKGFKENKQSVGELWLGYLRYYVEVFDFEKSVISIRKFKPLSKFEKFWSKSFIAIEDPFNLSHNLGAGVSRNMFQYIMNCFLRARARCGSNTHIPPEVKPADFFFDIRYLTAHGNVPKDRCCRRCGRIGHIASKCENKIAQEEHKRENQERRRFREGTPNKSNGRTHYNKQQDGAQQSPGNWRDSPRDRQNHRERKIVCFNCNEEGHMRNECPSPRKQYNKHSSANKATHHGSQTKSKQPTKADFERGDNESANINRRLFEEPITASLPANTPPKTYGSPSANFSHSHGSLPLPFPTGHPVPQTQRHAANSPRINNPNPRMSINGEGMNGILGDGPIQRGSPLSQKLSSPSPQGQHIHLPGYNSGSPMMGGSPVYPGNHPMTGFNPTGINELFKSQGHRSFTGRQGSTPDKLNSQDQLFNIGRNDNQRRSAPPQRQNTGTNLRSEASPSGPSFLDAQGHALGHQNFNFESFINDYQKANSKKDISSTSGNKSAHKQRDKKKDGSVNRSRSQSQSKEDDNSSHGMSATNNVPGQHPGRHRTGSNRQSKAPSFSEDASNSPHSSIHPPSLLDVDVSHFDRHSNAQVERTGNKPKEKRRPKSKIMES